MITRILLFLALAFVVSVTPSWAQEPVPCSGEGTVISCSFSSTQTTNTYEFFSDGRLVVQFDTVLTSFDLTVTVVHVTDPLPLDPKEFPSGTVCVKYSGNGGQCDRYDFSGTAVTGGFNGVPVKNKDYKGLITLTLSYVNSGSQVIQNPAFGHAPGDITTFTENILTSYSVIPEFSDPTMGGKVPGLSSVVALDEPLTENDTFCSLTLTPTNNPSEQKPQIEVTLKIVSGSNCAGTGLRDKTASLSVSTTDGVTVSFPALKNVEGNKFHWDSKAGLNEYDISTDGLVSGQTYTVTVFSSKISPQSATFVAP